MGNKTSLDGDEVTGMGDGEEGWEERVEVIRENDHTITLSHQADWFSSSSCNSSLKNKKKK